jgi:hypothetical protein
MGLLKKKRKINIIFIKTSRSVKSARKHFLEMKEITVQKNLTFKIKLEIQEYKKK